MPKVVLIWNTYNPLSFAQALGLKDGCSGEGYESIHRTYPFSFLSFFNFPYSCVPYRWNWSEPETHPNPPTVCIFQVKFTFRNYCLTVKEHREIMFEGGKHETLRSLNGTPFGHAYKLILTRPKWPSYLACSSAGEPFHSAPYRWTPFRLPAQRRPPEFLG